MDYDDLCHMVETCRMPELAQELIDAGIADVIIPGETLPHIPGRLLSLEDALRDLLSAGIGGGHLAGLALFERRVLTMLPDQIERYAREHGPELTALIEERAAEMREGDRCNR